ncbi:uncharacterized protein ARMOST_22467 [Armillaria ostoyae]|uniref:Uncharacterized protein n=1 Tax=Armillaria ostoyae TaxID=47428 RepID=A0A284SCZ0_ARMOS|nr:uncharacterized protein ARMOST_22467 [Armillaria ostoyae]
MSLALRIQGIPSQSYMTTHRRLPPQSWFPQAITPQFRFPWLPQAVPPQLQSHRFPPVPKTSWICRALKTALQFPHVPKTVPPKTWLSPKAAPVVGNPLSASSSPSKFFFQQTGFPVVSYTVKTVEDVNFALEVKGGAPLIGNTDPSGSNQCQKWFVDCSSCSSADVSQTKGKVTS